MSDNRERLLDMVEQIELILTHVGSDRAALAEPSDGSGGELRCEVVREFPDLPRIEGVATDAEGRFHYVSDEDEGVAFRFTRIVAAS